MRLLALGLNHQTAPIEVRERAAFSPDSIGDALADLTQTAGTREAAILSTCNRTEIYCGRDRDNDENVVSWLSEQSGLEASLLGRSLYRFPDEEAVRHAFRVASGLDSMVLGEPQILGQMKDAFHTAARFGAAGKILHRMFEHTFSVAKRVRTDTDIGTNAVSVAYTGVSLAKRLFSELRTKTVLLIGAGETIELVARHLKQNGVHRIIIANRSMENARVLADQVDGEAISLAQIPNRLAQADIVVTSTASTLPILGKGAIEAALRKRKHAPMFILDLAVPRDVEAEAAKLKDVYLYTVDDLQFIVDENKEQRKRAAEEAEIIIDFQVVKFMRWMRSLDSVSAVKSFRDGLDEIKRLEMARALKKLRNGSDPEKVIERFANDLISKVAHGPIRALRQADMEGNKSVIAAARKLFNL